MRRLLLLAPLAALIVGCQSSEGSAKDFSVVPLDDQAKKVTLADFKGKTVLLDFWATWCGPCRDSMPEIQAMWDKYHSKGLEVVSISNEDRATLLAFHKSSPFTYPVYLDSTNKVSEAYAVEGIPRFILIKGGKIVWQQEGFDQPGDISSAVEREMN
jgi:cytochrome c biogenesis protein CcmG/thiol:disulfide interchange protein DsbE